jgi:hypothetical protein
MTRDGYADCHLFERWDLDADRTRAYSEFLGCLLLFNVFVPKPLSMLGKCLELRTVGLINENSSLGKNNDLGLSRILHLRREIE